MISTLEAHRRAVAKVLFDVEAVRFDTKNLFQYVSGMLSPMYVDNRKVISFPEARKIVVDGFTDVVGQVARSAGMDVLAGVATGGVPWAAWAAYALEAPLIYVRPAPKDRGMKKQVEGVLNPGRRVVVIEDLITTGLSSVNAAESIRDAGGVVEDCVSIFSFDSPASAERYASAGLRKQSLTNLSTLLEVGVAERRLDENQVGAIRNWAETTLANFRG